MPHPRQFLLMLLMLVLATSAACSSPSSPGPDAAPPPPTPSPLPLLWEVDARPMQQPIGVAGLVIGVERRGAGPALVARDPSTGDARWAVPIGPGYSPTGWGLGWAVVGKGREARVALLRPTGTDREADLVIVRPRDGRTQVVAGRTVFDSTPYACRGRRSVCVEVPGAVRSDGSGAVRVAVVRGGDPGAGFRVARRSQSEGMLGVSGDDLFLDQSAGMFQEALVRVVDGHTRWRRDLDGVFGPHSTGLYGSEFSRQAGVVWGSLSVGLTREHGRRVRVIDRQPMAALDLSTAEILWRERGVTTFCAPADVDLASPDDSVDPDQPRIRCRVSGRLVSRGGPELVESQADPLTLAIEPFDPRTGASGSWRIQVANPSAFARADTPLPLAAVGTVVVETEEGRRVVDLRTGEQRDVRAEETFVCRRSVEVHLPDDDYRRQVGSLLRGCDAAGRPTGGDFPAELVAAVAPRVGEVRVVATPTGLQAYEAG